MLHEIVDYLKRTKMPETTFGRRVASDPRLVGDIRWGRTPRPAMVERIRAFMAENPEG